MQPQPTELSNNWLYDIMIIIYKLYSIIVHASSSIQTGLNFTYYKSWIIIDTILCMDTCVCVCVCVCVWVEFRCTVQELTQYYRRIYQVLLSLMFITKRKRLALIISIEWNANLWFQVPVDPEITCDKLQLLNSNNNVPCLHMINTNVLTKLDI
jgi:hypothetical protein